MRKLKFHEQRLLRKTNFLEYKKTNTVREHHVICKYQLEDRGDYAKYNAVVMKIRKLLHAVCRLGDSNLLKKMLARNLIAMLYKMGVIQSKRLVEVQNLTVSAFCERRLASLLVRNEFVSNFKDSTLFTRHGHVFVGNTKVVDPGFIVVRAMERFIRWDENSKILKTIENFETSIK